MRDPLPDLQHHQGLNMALPTSADLGCETLLGLYHEAYGRIARLLKAPLELLALADSLLGYPFDLAERLLDEALALADFLKFDLAPAGMLDALNKLMDCPFVADGPLGARIAEAIDTLTETGDLPSQVASSLQSAVAGRVGGVLDKVRETPAGALAQLNDAYDSILERSGVNDSLRALRDLEACLRNACAGYDSLAQGLPGSSEELLASMRGKLDEAGNVVGDVVGKAENVPAAAKEGYAAVRQKAAEAASRAGRIVMRRA